MTVSALMEAAVIEPETGSSQWQALQQLTKTPDPVAANVLRR
ncbi:MAG: hypothetical protein OSA88_11440 [Acidimicrobiales bacterium]|nr:hypothetical protein [Acidimicrobiales bacterium]